MIHSIVTSEAAHIISIDELKLLLTLNSNKQLPHLETEIFANSALTSIYLLHLTYDRFNTMGYNSEWLDVEWEECSDVEYLSWGAHYYATEILGCRWLAAEHIVKLSDSEWRMYCSKLNIE